MGLSLLAYFLLALSGFWMWRDRQNQVSRPDWLKPAHYITGGIMVALVLLLLVIGVVGTLGHYGSMGHSSHLPIGLLVVSLVLLSAWSATQISAERPWARPVHISTNITLLIAFALVSLTGWIVVQKYLP